MKLQIGLFAALFLVSCSHRDIVPAAPDEASYAPPPEATASEINVPIKVSLTELARTINANVPNELYKDLKGSDIGYGATVAMRIVRNGVIYLTTANGKVTTHIPIKIVDGNVAVGALGLKKNTPFDAAMHIQMNTVVAADKNWNFASATSSDFEWSQEPSLRVAGLAIPIGRLCRSSVKAQLDAVAPMIDKQIKDLVSLRSTMEGLWRGMDEPRLMTSSPTNVWLHLRPMAFSVTQPQSLDKTTLLMNVGIKTMLNTNVGSKPDKQNLGGLPDLQILPFGNNNRFQMEIPAVIRYDDIKNMIQSNVVGQRYPVKEGVTLLIKGFDFIPRGDKIAMTIDFITIGKKSQGKFYLVGKPMLDKTTQTLYFEDLDFDIKSKNVLLGSATFLLHKPLLNKIKEQATYSLIEQLNAAKVNIQQILNDYALSDNLFVKGNVEGLNLDKIYLGRDFMSIYILSNGTLEGGFRHK